MFVLVRCFGVRWLLVVVCCLLCDVRCVGVCCLVFWCLLFVVRCLLSVVYWLLFVVCCLLLFVVFCLVLVV